MVEGGFVELELIPSPGLALWREQEGEEEGRRGGEEETAAGKILLNTVLKIGLDF